MALDTKNTKTIAAAALILGVAAAAVHLAGPGRIWTLFGPPDLGDVDFATLERRTTPNDALACSPGLCAARADRDGVTVQLSPQETIWLVRRALAGEPRLHEVAADPARGRLRYVQYSHWLGFPDTINVQVIGPDTGPSTVLLYSRSQLGRGDFGVNRARIERWIGLIELGAQK